MYTKWLLKWLKVSIIILTLATVQLEQIQPLLLSVCNNLRHISLGKQADGRWKWNFRWKITWIHFELILVGYEWMHMLYLQVRCRFCLENYYCLWNRTVQKISVMGFSGNATHVPSIFLHNKADAIPCTVQIHCLAFNLDS